jgi:uncharacterized protein (UPF0212 family)
MKKLLLVLLMLFVPMAAFADEAPQQSQTKAVDMCANAEQTIKNLNLSQTQADTLRQACTISNPTPETSTWSSNVKTISTAIGLAISDTAKQLNVTVNDFVKSPAGIITVSIIVAKMFGAGILRFISLSVVWLILTWLLIFMLKRCLDYHVERTPVKVLWGLWTRMRITKREYTSFGDISSDAGITLFISAAAYFVGSLLIWCNMF